MESKKLEDRMDSFFLSETTKYLYLLFDRDNFVHKGNYIFTTEAHLLPMYVSYSELGIDHRFRNMPWHKMGKNSNDTCDREGEETPSLLPRYVVFLVFVTDSLQPVCQKTPSFSSPKPKLKVNANNINKSRGVGKWSDYIKVIGVTCMC